MGGLRGESRIHKKGELEMVAVGVSRCMIAVYDSIRSVLLGGSGGMPPRKILDFRPSEIVSGAILGRLKGGSRIHKKGVLEMVAVGVPRV